MSKDAKKLYVAVEATLFHANEELKSGKLSSSHHLSSNGVIEWQEAVLFGLQIKNLPRVSLSAPLPPPRPHPSVHTGGQDNDSSA